MSKIALSAPVAGVGTATIKGPETASDIEFQLPPRAGQVMVAGPAFSAHRLAAGSAAPGYSKVIMDTEAYDFGGSYDVTTGRFQPQVAGLYQVNGKAELNTTTGTAVAAAIYKNGVLAFLGGVAIGSAAAFPGSTVGALVSMNGSTDYIELFVFNSNASAISYLTGEGRQFFQACLVRPA